jgi:hypothetical protein
MPVRLNRQVKAELDDIWLYIAVESSSLEIADRVVETITDTFFSCQNIQTLAAAVTTSARACGVSTPAATL